MSSPAAVVGLRFDGVDLQLEDLQIFLEISKGLNESPSVRGVDTIVPARAGRIQGNRINDILPIVLEGLVSGDETAGDRAAVLSSYRGNMATIRDLFRSDRSRATLEADLEDGRTLAIEARPLNQTWLERRIHATGSIELEGDDDWVELGS